MWKWMGLDLWRNIFQDAEVIFFFYSRLGSYIISIVNTVSKKIGAFIYSTKFISPEVAFVSL